MKIPPNLRTTKLATLSRIIELKITDFRKAYYATFSDYPDTEQVYALISGIRERLDREDYAEVVTEGLRFILNDLEG